MSVDLSRLHVITMVSNPQRWRSRPRLYKHFKHHIEHDLGMKLWTCEIAMGARPFEITCEDDPHALQIRTHSEMWHKENALNLIMQRLPSDWWACAWLDADIHFCRKDIFKETMHQLQHHPIVQLWSNATDLDPRGRILKTAKSFAACWIDGHCTHPSKDNPYSYAHTGYAWAARRDILESLGSPLTAGPLLDFAPLGSADFYMAWAAIQELTPHLQWRLKQGFTPGYINQIAAWQDNAKVINKDVGLVEGTILHHWHGKKEHRFYNSREDILIKNKFDPSLDLMRDDNDLWKFTGRNYRLRMDIRHYLHSRNEDDISL